jgi:hypothetical protein
VGTEATGRGACGKSTTMSNSPRLHAVEAVPPPHRKPLLCFSPLLDHLTQSCYPEDLQEALRPFDDAILTTAKHALGLDLADQIALRRARLPPFAVRPPAEATWRARGRLPPRRSFLGGGRTGDPVLFADRPGAPGFLPELVDVGAGSFEQGGGRFAHLLYITRQGCRLADELEGAWGNTPLGMPQNTSTHSCAYRISYKVGEIPRREYPKIHRTATVGPATTTGTTTPSAAAAARAKLPQHPTPNRPSLMHLQQAAPGQVSSLGGFSRAKVPCVGALLSREGNEIPHWEYPIGNTPKHTTPTAHVKSPKGREIPHWIYIPPNPSGWAWWRLIGTGSQCRTTPHRYSCRSESRRSRAAPAPTPSRSSLGHLQQAPDQVRALGASF